MQTLKEEIKKHIIMTMVQRGFFSLEDFKEDVQETALSDEEKNELIFQCVVVLNQLDSQYVISLEEGGFATLVDEEILAHS